VTEATTPYGWDWVDPEDFYVAHVAARERSFWLDGSGSRPWSGRMTYVGWAEPQDVSLTYHAATRTVSSHVDGQSSVIGGDVFSALVEVGARLSSGVRAAGWVGWLGYAARPDLPALIDPAADALDACWIRARRRVAFDHHRRRVYAVAPPDERDAWARELAPLIRATPRAREPAPAPAAIVVDTLARDDYATAFAAVQRELRLGNSYETNLTYRMRVASDAGPVDTYRRLRRLSPAPYAALIRHGEVWALSSSPERFATIRADRTVETRPIKGTTPRDPDPERDRLAANRLRHEPKFVGENLMIVDLLRNDMSQVCLPGTVEVTDLMHVESYPSVHQLVTTITGRLADGVGTVDALAALFPGGSMTGAPKLRTMEVIADVEESPRGVYSGAIGWLLDDGSADLGIVIRTLVRQHGEYVLGTGGGITVRSDCDDEFAETGWKARSLLAALGIHN
jgi:aminodeoxychorismate synthase component I